jgi:hypothetical protein
MKAFTYQRASSPAQAAAVSAQPNTRIIAGGTKGSAHVSIPGRKQQLGNDGNAGCLARVGRRGSSLDMRWIKLTAVRKRKRTTQT